METTPILPVKINMCWVWAFLLISASFMVNAQPTNPKFLYIDSLTAIITNRQTDETTRLKASDDLRMRLMLNLKEKDLSQADNNHIWHTLRELQMSRGVFAPKKNPPDTLNIEVLHLEQKLAAYQDSITAIQHRLIRIIEDKEQARISKEKATFVLASIHKQEVVEYLLEHEPELQFGKFGSDYKQEEDAWRTAMVAINREYIDHRNWLIFPYLFKNLKRSSFSEMGLILGLLIYPEYKKPWLALEFMNANAEPGSKEVIQYLLNETHEFKRPKESKDK